ncbi:MAG: aminotransferase class III-fold pyridoxal phosphate-dependent enzyme, partial [Gemmatimonadetes bacterium]|nr:aminotransferase class III-fold pyridoxal phosphate-dependent enzyme [Gemmatimonadota bacterium]
MTDKTTLTEEKATHGPAAADRPADGPSPSKGPRVEGALPGAKALEWIARDKETISPSYTRSYGAVIERGEGCRVWDVDGHEFIDVSAGIAVCATGHCHPAVVRAIQE